MALVNQESDDVTPVFELYSFCEVHKVLNPILHKNIILFLHAWSGCDTASATFGQRKTHGKSITTKEAGNLGFVVYLPPSTQVYILLGRALFEVLTLDIV